MKGITKFIFLQRKSIDIEKQEILIVSLKRNKEKEMKNYDDLVAIFTGIDNPEEMEIFFREIFTPKELKDLTLRWQLLKELHEGRPQRKIAEKYHISLCKITRGSKILKNEPSITRAILDKYYGKKSRR